MLRSLPTDVSSFKTLRTGDYTYVDKTEHMYNLFSGGSRYYFLSRPRRFGKSLLISTLYELFSGNKALFDGLWISTSSYDWQEYPVIQLDFSTIDYKTPQELDASLQWTLDAIAKSYGVDVSGAPGLKLKLRSLVEQLSQKNKVVVLIDEYDKPILDHLKNVHEAEAIRDALRGFYDALKGLDSHLRAIFITGVTKFAKTSIFSGINNLNDISIKPEAASLLGYTYVEITQSFGPHLEQLAQQHGHGVDNELALIQQWYNGYQFSDKDIKVYNPFSVLYYLKDAKLRNYWFESGTPSFLVTYLRTQYDTLQELSLVELSPESLSSFQIHDIPLIPLLFQTGYLTIIAYNPVKDTFRLGFPNVEVADSFNKFLVATLAHSNVVTIDTAQDRLLRALEAYDLKQFCKSLQALFAHIPYTLHIKKESYYHSLFQFLMSLLSRKAQSEILTNQGRIDLVVSTKTYRYIFELKLNVDSQKALEQILNKRYYESFIDCGKKIILVGLSFKMHEGTFDVEYSSQEMVAK
ncbi:MAG: AAA family ATPase [Candidatus Dependentiae bacterium]|nr:AAA family ATPase [Candidatus Dependentiae bacterium]